MRCFKLLIDKKFKFLAFIQVITQKLDIFPSLPLEGGGSPSEHQVSDAVDGRSFLGIKLLNFILHAYSFSLTFVRQLPLGGSLKIFPKYRA